MAASVEGGVCYRLETPEANVARLFKIKGEVKTIVRKTKGYINRTYLVECYDEECTRYRYLLQRVNSNVFPDIPLLIKNYKYVTKHLKGKLRLVGHRASMECTPQMIKTKSDDYYIENEMGFWRMLTYFSSAYSMDLPESGESYYYAGQCFAQFLCELSDVPAEDIGIVIPDFHNTLKRYNDLEKAINKDKLGRVNGVAREIEFIRARKDEFGVISSALSSGKIPTRITHNDTNLNNILFDRKTSLPIAIIDLDTVMPSSALYDFGDSIRIGTNTARDDEKDLSKVMCDLFMYEQYARGYLEVAGSMLTKEELSLFPLASRLLTIEDGIRFLTDYIEGDTYFNTNYEGQNLDRCRTQLALVADMEKKSREINAIFNKIYKTLDLKVVLE